MLYYFYKIGRYLALKMPLNIAYKAAVILADIYHFFAWNDRKNLEYNLKIVLKTDDKEIIANHTKSVFRNFAKYLVDFFRFAKLNRDYILSHITIEGKENIDKALARGKGVIILAAHIGNWELGGAITASLGYPFYAIALDHKDKRINDFFLGQRGLCNVKIIPIGARLKNCFKVLKKNLLLGIIADRDFSAHGEKTNFFGRPTLMPKGPAFFSLKTGASIIPLFPLRTKDDRFKVVFEEALESKSTGNEEADIKSVMEEYIAVIERYIRAFPDQWFVFRKVWQ